MKNYKVWILAVLSIFFISCGGGGSSASSNNENKQMEAKFIDAPVWGLKYISQNGEVNYTKKDGTFIYKNGTTKFYVGKVYIGEVKAIPVDKKVFIHDLFYDVKRGDISNKKVLKVATFLQSIDSKSDDDTLIEISKATKDSFSKITQSINLVSSKQSVEEVLLEGGFSTKEKTKVQEHLKKVFSKNKIKVIEEEKKTVESTKPTEEKKTEKPTETIKYKYPEVSDKYKDMQWNLFKPDERYTKPPFNVSNEANIHFGDYHRKYRGKGVKIAVIDSGLDVNQEDLKGAIVNTYDIETGGTNVAGSGKDASHGTGTTGIIAARANDKGIFGVASQSEIIFIKHKKNMNDDEMIKMFEKAEEFGADIINCSWGSGVDDETGKVGVSDKAKAKIIDLAKNGRDGKGTIIVFSSGNSNKDIETLNLEANIPEVISVGASSEQNERSAMSNYGKNLDVLAPGGNTGLKGLFGIPTLAPMGQVEDNTVSTKGTSIAAPIVSGVIALMLEKNPNLSRDEVEKLLRSTADKIGAEPYVDGRNDYYGYGKINVKKLLDAVK